jgi:hypothetical protein
MTKTIPTKPALDCLLFKITKVQSLIMKDPIDSVIDFRYCVTQEIKV